MAQLMFGPIKKPFSLLGKVLRRYFLVGLIVTLPFVIASTILYVLIDYLDQILVIRNGRWLFFIPERFHPDVLLGFHVIGLGFIFIFTMILIVGVISRSYLGRKFFGLGDWIIARVPIARTIYNIAKEILQTYANREKTQFSKVVLLEYPRLGIYSLGFVTGIAVDEIQKRTSQKVVNVFVPTSPNPTSGYFLMLPEKDITVLDMQVDEAFRLIISAGAVSTEAPSSNKVGK